MVHNIKLRDFTAAAVFILKEIIRFPTKHMILSSKEPTDNTSHMLSGLSPQV